MTETFAIAGMHCGNCVARVADALKPYATNVAVTLDPPRAVLTGAHGYDLAQLNAAVAKAGQYSLAPEKEGADRPPPPGISPPEILAGSATVAKRSWLEIYRPLLIIVAYIAAASFAGTGSFGEISWPDYMTNVMAGFFLIFSGFKLLNLGGFADAYATYDLLAKRWRAWGSIYPFLELALGLAYLYRVQPAATNVATILLMGFSSLGVIGALREKRQIQCACLGTVLNLPMSTITLIEDLAMVAMATMALAYGHN